MKNLLYIVLFYVVLGLAALVLNGGGNDNGPAPADSGPSSFQETFGG